MRNASPSTYKNTLTELNGAILSIRAGYVGKDRIMWLRELPQNANSI